MSGKKKLKIIKYSKGKNSNEGHRKRLRERFLQSGLDGFLDYEIVELLLTLGTPRRDCKQAAKAAIKEFKGLKGVLDATLDDLQIIKGIGPSNAFGIKLFQSISERYAKEKIPSKISLSSHSSVIEFLQEKLGREKKEHFIALLLDSQNNLIKIIDISIGTINSTMVHPREVFEPAIRYLASHIVIAHNHPSGDLKPSIEDLKITQRLISVGDTAGINIIDHYIVSSMGYLSMREQGML